MTPLNGYLDPVQHNSTREEQWQYNLVTTRKAHYIKSSKTGIDLRQHFFFEGIECHKKSGRNQAVSLSWEIRDSWLRETAESQTHTNTNPAYTLLSRWHFETVISSWTPLTRINVSIRTAAHILGQLPPQSRVTYSKRYYISLVERFETLTPRCLSVKAGLNLTRLLRTIAAVSMGRRKRVVLADRWTNHTFYAVDQWSEGDG